MVGLGGGGEGWGHTHVFSTKVCLCVNMMYVFRQLKDPELTVDIIQGDTVATTATIKARTGNPNILFEFSDGAAAVLGMFNMKQKTVSFDDGNVWTKY